MPKFRKKPIVVEAMQWDGTNPIAIMAFMKSKSIETSFLDDWLEISSLGCKIRINLNDWIIKGIKGEFYPCDPDIFEATYERIEE